ncbi:MAG: B12-binding domain-containing radical SAM protein [Candidatus Scalinduaceae bacterium]
MKIVLIRPPFISGWKGSPLGLAYLNGVLKKHGHDSIAIDLNLEINNTIEILPQYTRDFTIPDDHPAIDYTYKRLDQYCEMVLASEPEIVGFSLGYPTVEYGIAMAKILSKHVRCIAGGPQATYNEEDLLSIGCFDTVVSGYGEEAILEALNSKGIIQKPLVPKKEYLPDYTGIEIDKYNGELSVVTTRGCPYKCHFCTQHLPYYFHSIDTVVNQIKNTPNATGIMYNDSSININNNRTAKLFEEISTLDTKPPGHIFGMQIHEGYKNYVSKMASAGVREARVGIESGSMRERNSMNKPKFDNDLIVEFVKELTKYKILTLAQYIICYPDETEEDRMETFALMNRINSECDSEYVKHWWFQFVVHHGGEKLFKEKYGVVKDSPKTWRNSTYTPDIINKTIERFTKIVPENATVHS